MVTTPIRMKNVFDREIHRSSVSGKDTLNESFYIAYDSLKKGKNERRLIENFLSKCQSKENASKCTSKLFSLNEIASEDISKDIVDSFCEDIIPYISDLSVVLNEMDNHDLSQETKEKITNAITEMKISDRIINNHAKLNRTFKLHEYMESHKYAPYDETIFGLCERVETFDCPRYASFNIALEEVLYNLFRNAYVIPKPLCIESIVDYFLFSEFDESLLNQYKKVLENNHCISDEDISRVKYLFESENYADSNDVSKLIQDFKKDEKKDPNKLKHIVNKLFGKSPENIIDGTPHILNVVRYCVYFGTFAVAPYIAIPSIMIDLFIQMTVNRYQSERMLKKFNKELNKVSNSIERTNNPDKLDNLSSYKSCLEKCISKLEDYSDSLYTDAEKDARYEIESCIENSDCIRLEEFKNTHFSDIKKLANAAQEAINKTFSHSKDFIKNIQITGEKDSLLESNILSLLDENSNLDICVESFNCENNTDNHFIMSRICNVLNNTYCSGINKAFYYESVAGGMELRLIDCNPISLTESDETEIASMFSGMDFKKICDIEVINEGMNGLSKLFDNCNSDPVLFSEALSLLEEVDIDKKNDDDKEKKEKKKLFSGVNVNSLRLALRGLKDKGKELSGKEQQFSRQLDYTASALAKSVESAMTNDRREAIIKGSVIPAASKCLKIAIAMAGVAAFVNPGIAAITLLAGLANSKRLNRKERQLLMDEIEVELKIVEKEISMADNDGNTKKLRTLMQYQKTLQREYQKLKYNMRVNTKTPMDNVRAMAGRVDPNKLHASISSTYGVPGEGDD